MILSGSSSHGFGLGSGAAGRSKIVSLASWRVGGGCQLELPEARVSWAALPAASPPGWLALKTMAAAGWLDF